MLSMIFRLLSEKIKGEFGAAIVVVISYLVYLERIY